MIEGYKLGRKIGEGTFGAVFEATNRDGLQVAVKISLRPLSTASTKEAMLMQNEIEAMRRLQHPSLVRVHDAGFTDDGRVWIAMELITGEPLDRYLEHREKLDAIEAIRITAAIADAVAVCHELDILHLDLKPQNIILDDPHAPAIKVLDFGLAHLTSAWQAGREASGTPYYMSPERFEAASPNVRDDLYAIGVILYELLTGDVPFAGETLNAIYAAKCVGEHEPASAKSSGVSPALDSLLTALLGPARETRPSSARHLANELSELAFETLAGFSNVAPERPLELASIAGELPLVGRHDDLAALLRATQTRTDTGGSGIVVVGEVGVGKSRLLARYLDEIDQERAVAVGYGRCRELANALPYSPWREALGRLAEANPGCVNALAPTLGPVSGLLMRLIPELSGRLQTSTGEVDDDGTPVAVALTSLLASIGGRAPCVIVIEDIHWADAGSRAVLEHLAKNGVPEGITIVATTRGEASVPSGFEKLDLGPLSESEGDALIALGLGGSDDLVVAELKEQVPLLTTGNPLVTIQVLRHLETDRCLVRDGATLSLDEGQLRDYQPPDCVRGVIAASLSGLSEETRSVLAVGALLGRRFRCADLYQLDVFEREAIKRTFNEALAAQVLSRSQCGNAAIFVHDTVREELSSTLGEDETRSLHLGIAKLLESRSASASELAHHYDLGGDCENAARTHLEAGRDARALHAPIDATIHFERATANALRTVSSEERDQLLFRTTFELVGASSQLGNTEETLAHLDRCSDALRRPSLEARIALEAGYARVFYVRGQFDLAARHSASCLELASGNPAFGSYTLIPLALSGRGLTASGRFGPAADTLAKVADLSEQQGEWVELAHSTGVRGISLAFAGRFREAHDSVDRSIDIAHHLGDPIRMLAGLFYRTVVAEAAHDLELGLAASTHALRYAKERDIGGMYLYLTTLFAGRQQFHAGELDRAKLLLTRSLDTGGRLEISMGRGWNYAFLGDVFFAKGEVAAARRCYESAIELGDKNAGDEYAGPAGLIGLAHCMAREGGSDREVDTLAAQAVRRLEAVGNISFLATVRDRLASIWEERGRIDRAVRAARDARDAFMQLRVNRRAWRPGSRRDTPHRRRRSPSRHPTLIGAAAAPASM